MEHTLFEPQDKFQLLIIINITITLCDLNFYSQYLAPAVFTLTLQLVWRIIIDFKTV